MARAKRTDRAEARRRTRAVAADPGENDENGESRDTDAASSSRRPDRSRSAAPAATPRMKLGAALRLAIQPAPIREDIAAFPSVIRQSRGVWIAVALVVGSGILFLAPGGSTNPAITFIATMMLFPPPMAAAFLSGILVPRASWLAGFLLGLISGIVYVFTVVPITASQASPPITDAQRDAAVAFALFISPSFGLFVGAFAGFYRRFLRYSAPPPRPRGGQTGRQATRRR